MRIPVVSFTPSPCHDGKLSVSPSISAAFLTSESCCLHTKHTGGTEIGWALLVFIC